MTRLSYVDPAHLSPEQKELYDSIASGPRAAKRASLVDSEGHLTGPFNAFLHLPAVGKHWSAIGEALRFHTTLDRRLFELAILVIAVHWRAAMNGLRMRGLPGKPASTSRHRRCSQRRNARCWTSLTSKRLCLRARTGHGRRVGPATTDWL
jgi:hypothetical protein